MYKFLYIYKHHQSKVFGHPKNFLFLILKVLFIMKQVKHHNGLCGRLENYINLGRFRPWRMKKTSRRATRHYAALGAGLAPNCSELNGRENPELY